MNKALAVVYVILGLGILSLVLLFISQMGFITGNWSFIINHYIALLSWLGLIGLSFYWLMYRFFYAKSARFLGSFFLCSMIGVGMAGLSQYLYNNNIWLDQYITASHTIEELMLLIIVVWVIVGLIVGSLAK